MATPKIVADFETQLATALSIGDTSFTLASATDDDGVSLPTGKYYFTIDNGTSQKEYVVGTVTGISVASVSNVTRQGTESSGVDRAHRVGASVIISDFLTYKNYIDETTVAGAADADAITKGVVEVPTSAEIDADTSVGGTGASLAISPDQLVLSKYGTNLPSDDEKDALDGSGTPSSSNKFVTQDTVDALSFLDTISVQTFTSSGTWTKPAGLVYAVIEVQGGGGGGQGDAANPISGGAGGYARKLVTAGNLAASETVTVGAGGAGDNSSGNGAADGGTSSFTVDGGSTVTANGGSSGPSAGTGGSASNGDINCTGSKGGVCVGGHTSSFFGGGYGYGGGGGVSADPGQAGGAGLVVVTEYLSS